MCVYRVYILSRLNIPEEIVANITDIFGLQRFIFMSLKVLMSPDIAASGARRPSDTASVKSEISDCSSEEKFPQRYPEESVSEEEEVRMEDEDMREVLWDRQCDDASPAGNETKEQKTTLPHAESNSRYVYCMRRIISEF